MALFKQQGNITKKAFKILKNLGFVEYQPMPLCVEKFERYSIHSFINP